MTAAIIPFPLTRAYRRTAPPPCAVQPAPGAQQDAGWSRGRVWNVGDRVYDPLSKRHGVVTHPLDEGEHRICLEGGCAVFRTPAEIEPPRTTPAA